MITLTGRALPRIGGVFVPLPLPRPHTPGTPNAPDIRPVFADRRQPATVMPQDCQRK